MTTHDQDDERQAVFIHLNATDLPGEIYEKYDVATLEDSLNEVLRAKALGVFDGTESGPRETILFLYGPDAEKLFVGIEQTLRDYPLCRGAKVEIRHDGVGASSRIIRL